MRFPDPELGGPAVTTGWGVTRHWPAGTPGGFPVHDEAHIVCPDVAEWKKYVKMPPYIFPEEEWEQAVKHAESVDRNEKFVAAYIAPGIFEQCHYLMEIQNCLISFYEEPEAMHELIDYITEWECKYAEQLCKYIKPDAIFHHDDWGTQISTFISPEMFEEYYLPAYKKVYNTFRENGVKLVVHHSDSYEATLVPVMIEMGIDIWQGVMRSNDISVLIEKYGDKITFMGGVDSALVDFPGWKKIDVANVVEETCRDYGKGKKYFIPCQSQGLHFSTFKGVYEAIDEEIDKMSAIMFK